ncbi:MAG: hypothetical protein M3Q65_06230 [Chloroflexota bacterium]|nr:hypothetical protein [Chloroflexota bacterium]
MRGWARGRSPLVGPALVAVLAATLAGCGAPEGGDSRRTAAPSAVMPVTPQSVGGAPTVQPEPTPSGDVLPGEESLSTTPVRNPPARPDLTQTVAALRDAPIPSPPAGTLAYGGQSRSGRTGSFWWTTREGDHYRVAHADAPGIPVPPPAEALTVPVRAVLTFTFGGENPPIALAVAAYVLDDQSPRAFGTEQLKTSGQRVTTLPARQAGFQAEFAADLAAGEYVIVVEARARNAAGTLREDYAHYSFRVVVEWRGQGPAPPPTPTTVVQEP